MADEKHITFLNKGVDFWNEWRANNPYVEIDLTNIQLVNIDLQGAKSLLRT